MDTTTADPYNATRWAREHGKHYHATVALDNHEPPRSYASLDFYTYVNPNTGAPQAILAEVIGKLRDAQQSIYLIDDGRTVTPHYVAGWRHNEYDACVFLHPFPVNVDPLTGRPIQRADGRGLVDYSSWQLGPRRAYHVKIRPA